MLHFSTPDPQESAAFPETDADYYIARLFGLFTSEELNIKGGEPLAGTFPARIQTSKFWQFQPCDTDRIDPIVMPFGPRQESGQRAVIVANLRMWSSRFYATRFDTETARDVLTLFLIRNLESLLHLYLRHQTDQQDLAALVNALCLHRADTEKLAPFSATTFSAWVLEDWLPRHLRNYRYLDLEADAAPGNGDWKQSQ